ncbi:MAG TPA: transcription elongation factor GreB [Candidatus Competibacteraceae bacterium]|nr:transcription elongation factor GreB [Candidatus Competibacteraceae bacterium]
MGRWRPPLPKSTPYITRAGYEALAAELDMLWRKVRPEVVAALAAAAAEGDRSENAEYTYRKKQLAEIDRRIRYLQKRLPTLKVVDAMPEDTSTIYFGAWIELENVDSGEVVVYRIVGPDETDPRLGWISIDSPLARAALRKRADDEFSARSPRGVLRYLVLSVSYEGPPRA